MRQQVHTVRVELPLLSRRALVMDLSNADIVYLDFTSGGAADGFYTISLINATQVFCNIYK